MLWQKRWLSGPVPLRLVHEHTLSEILPFSRLGDFCGDNEFCSKLFIMQPPKEREL